LGRDSWKKGSSHAMGEKLNNQSGVAMNMKKLLFKFCLCSLILLLCLVFSLSCSKKSDESSITVESKKKSSKEVIDFSLPDLEGNTINFSDFRGKVVIVDFWATWCHPCLIEIPHFIELYNTYSLEGLEIIGIAMQSGSPEDVIKKVQELNINYTVVMGNNEVAQKFGGIQGFPATFVMDKKGKVAKKYLGALPNIKELLESDIKTLF
jgi:thiol-disulfide isomerase/thioredoxin